MNFIEKLKNELNKNLVRTENGALGYQTSGNPLMDMNFKTSSYRELSDSAIIFDFMNAFVEDPLLAVKWIFFARDIRGGMGERRLFRVIIKHLADEQTALMTKLIPLIAEYGRYDDLFELFDTDCEVVMVKFVAIQFNKDLAECTGNPKGRPSLLAKWMPSINASSKTTIEKARKFVKYFGITDKLYRKAISGLRAQLNIVEQQMSAGQWQNINYKGVPSRANLVYNPAFLRHDEDRRRTFLEKVISGETTINSATNFPHDIVHKYEKCLKKDDTLEVLWKALPNYTENMGSTLVVADGSGSMTSTIGNTSVTALEVANALTIYFAERCSGIFNNTYITFSGKPQLVNLGDGSLYSKIAIAQKHDEVANTNIQAVFELILKSAVNSGMTQEDLPKTILIISDMEFDAASGYYGRGYSKYSGSLNTSLFETFAFKFAEHGYKLPRLVFWNVMSRTNTIPLQTNDLGVALVSGFSPAVTKMVLSNKVDPYDALLETLNGERYLAIEECLK